MTELAYVPLDRSEAAIASGIERDVFIVGGLRARDPKPMPRRPKGWQFANATPDSGREGLLTPAGVAYR